jgi:general secretion pathway protein K
VNERQRGVALISILLIVALVTALMYHLMTHQSLVVAQTRQMIRADQSLAYALGAEAYARQILFDDWNQPASRNADTLTEPWAIPMTPFDIDEGTLEISIVDLDRRFNLNSLAATGTTTGPNKNVQRFKTLLAALGMDPNVADAWRDWIDADTEATGYGAEDGVYLVANPPYRTANQSASSPTEIAALGLLDPEQYARLMPYVATLPTTTLKINVNTADAPVIESLSTRVTPAQAETLVQSQRHYEDVGALVGEMPELGDGTDAMAVVSSYFEIHARAEIDGFRTELTSVVHRDPSTGHIALLTRDFGKRLPSIVEAQEAQDGEDASNGSKSKMN